MNIELERQIWGAYDREVNQQPLNRAERESLIRFYRAEHQGVTLPENVDDAFNQIIQEQI
jgi:hypothetical protein